MNSLFCRHNRFTAECPICSKGSVLSREQGERPRPVTKAAPKARTPRGSREKPVHTFTGPYVSAGPFSREGRVYEVRLEKVPGGLRVAEWRGGALERHAPVLPASALRELVDEAGGRSLLRFDLPEPTPAAGDAVAASPGRAGDMRDELRVERVDEPGMVRVGRWGYWPGDDRWELHESPVMLPEQRFEQALLEAARLGLI